MLSLISDYFFCAIFREIGTFISLDIIFHFFYFPRISWQGRSLSTKYLIKKDPVISELSKPQKQIFLISLFVLTSCWDQNHPLVNYEQLTSFCNVNDSFIWGIWGIWYIFSLEYTIRTNELLTIHRSGKKVIPKGRIRNSPFSGEFFICKHYY